MVCKRSGSGSREVVLALRPQSSSESGQLHVCAEIPMRRGVVVVTGPNSYPTNQPKYRAHNLPYSSSLEPATISQLSALSLFSRAQSKGSHSPTL